MGKQKGKVAEREVARMLQGWWQAVDPTAQFVRTPQSGGWSTSNVRHDFRMSGDIMTTSLSFPFTVESKRREAWSPRNFVMGKPSPVWSWWRQAVGQAVELEAEPMLWLRRNAEPLAAGERACKGVSRKPPWIVLVRSEVVRAIGVFPDFVWSTDELVGIDLGGVVPVGYVHTRLLAVDPHRVVGLQWDVGKEIRTQWLERERLRKAAG